MSFMQWIENLDKILVVLINNDADQAWLDPVMTIIRYPFTWIPFYIFLLFYIIKKDKNRSWLFVLCSLACFAITDSVTSAIFKPLFERLRPCQDAELDSVLRNVVDCGGLYSLPSSHAANHFGLAAFWYGSIRIMTGKKWKWLWIWAIVIGYAQVYVGKHYPSDIALGALFGSIIGWLMILIFKRLWLIINKRFMFYKPSLT